MKFVWVGCGASQFMLYLQGDLARSCYLMFRTQKHSRKELALQSVEKSWFYCRALRPEAEVRLLCLPQTGGATTVFHAWADQLGDQVEVHALQLPGRERRNQEPLLRDLEQLLQGILSEVEQFEDRPLALFGFSFGAIVAFELARHLEQANRVRVCHLFTAARRAPQIGHNSLIHHLPDNEFLHRLQEKYGAFPPALRDSPELIAYFLPVIRADMTMLENYCYRDAVPLGCPITVYGGKEDVSTTLEQLSAWKTQTTASCEIKMFPGNHFFPQSASNEMLSDLATRLGI